MSSDPTVFFFYDTINRTFLSWLATIKMAQEWEITRFMPSNLHDWKNFIKPQELRVCMQRYGLQNQEVKGISPAAHGHCCKNGDRLYGDHQKAPSG